MSEKTVKVETEISFETFTDIEMAKHLKCSTAALRKWRRQGYGTRWTRVGRLVRYPQAWLRDWIEENASGKKR